MEMDFVLMVLMSSTAPASSMPLDGHHPTCFELAPTVQTCKDVAVPEALYSLTRDKRSRPASEDEEEYYELVEWIDLVCLGSKDVFEENVVGDHAGVAATPTKLQALSLRGLISSEWLTQTLIKLM
jgi:hypothetical protein